MKKIFLITILSLFFIQTNFSQISNEVSNDFTLKIMPLSLIDYTPRLRVGLDFKSNNKFGFGIDFGIGNNTVNKMRLNHSIWGQDYSFYEIRPEIKFIFINKKYFYFYNSIEFFYMNMNDVLFSNKYQKENSNVKTTYDKADFNKIKYGTNFKVGINLIASGRINFDFYLGFGIAERIISYSNVINPIDLSNQIITYEWFIQNYKYEGRKRILNFTMGIKFGFSFLKW